MQNNYKNIGTPNYGDEILHHIGGAFNDERMTKCTFMHTFGNITTVRNCSTNKQEVFNTDSFYTKIKLPKELSYPGTPIEYISMTTEVTCAGIITIQCNGKTYSSVSSWNNRDSKFKGVFS